MNESYNRFRLEAEEFCLKNTSFKYKQNGVEPPEIFGSLPLMDDDGVQIDSFDIKIICTPDYPQTFPHVFETGGRIPLNIDWHVYSDGHCCLCSIPEEIIVCNKGIDITTFIATQVTPYFFNQKYREMHGFFLKERSHGERGNIEFFEDTFGTSNLNKIKRLLSFIVNNEEPNRVSECFCGSGEKYRKCHRQAYKLLKPLPKIVLTNFFLFLT